MSGLVAMVVFVLGASGCKGCSKPAPNETDGAAPSASIKAPAPVRSAKPPRFAPATQSACYAIAKSRCLRAKSCGELGFSAREGGYTSCLDASRNACMFASASEAGGRDDSCVKAMTALSCAAAQAREVPAACNKGGTAEPGKACVGDAQCASAFCAGSPGACGTCAPAPKEGEACNHTRCGDGLACVADHCEAKAALGKPCKGPNGCVAEATCLVEGASPGKCVAPAKADAKCDPAGNGAPTCDVNAALYCDAASKTCKVETVLKMQDPCDDKVPGKICPGDAVCLDGKCRPKVELDSPCTPGTLCAGGATCIDGTCSLPDVATCAK